MKYINTKDLELEVSHYLQCEKESEVITPEELKEITNRLPSADVVEVVRCKDCKYKNRYFTACCKLDGLGAINLDSFCSKGERKETE